MNQSTRLSWSRGPDLATDQGPGDILSGHVPKG